VVVLEAAATPGGCIHTVELPGGRSGSRSAPTSTAASAAAGSPPTYEWVLDEGGDTPPAVALFDLMMLVENEGGATRTGSELTA
jgi:hypothetical protein